MNKKIAQVAIIGRANVGKSTLFNRLVEKNKALVSAEPGTTRDRNVDVVKWRDREFKLIDTGGLDVDINQGGEIEKGIVKQARQSIAQADLILFVVDIQDGVMPIDTVLAREIIKQGRKEKTILVANKADSLKYRRLEKNIYNLNLGEPQMVSAANGSGTGDLLDLVLKKIPLKNSRRQDHEEPAIKVAIIGKPNVGKSSLLNGILGEERVIVTPIAHTTREAHDIEFDYNGQKYILIDTAGIRKHNKILPGSLEYKSVDKTLAAIREADVVLLVTEAQKDIELQDKKITQEILEKGKSVVVVANKWDLIPDKDSNTVNKFIKYYQAKFSHLWWAPIIFVSAKNRKGTEKLLDLIKEIWQVRKTYISDKQLEKFLKSQISRHRPSRGRGLKNPYIYKIEQAQTDPPRFIIYVNDPLTLHFSYIRFLQNHLREDFKIIGTPIQIEVLKQPRSRDSDTAAKKAKK